MIIDDFKVPIIKKGMSSISSLKNEFINKKTILFGVPGAFTPTCSSQQLPGFESNFDKIKKLGIDEIYCVSVNDSFVMNAWSNQMNVKNVKMIPDGSGNFTRFMGMLIGKNHLGFGMRSWRYAAVINNGKLEMLMAEEGFTDDCELDPYENSSPVKILEYLKNHG